MRNNRIFPVLFAFLLAGFIIFQTACNKKCGSLQSSISGKVIGMYDFKECFLYAQFDSTLLIDSDTGFTNYKNKHFKNCTATLDPVDFSKNCLIGFKVRSIACNAVFNRNITIDSANKIYRYTVTVEKCAGCGTNITSTNIVLAPQIPAGYKLEFVSIGE
jgi:hypothetical protein